MVIDIGKAKIFSSSAGNVRYTVTPQEGSSEQRHSSMLESRPQFGLKS